MPIEPNVSYNPSAFQAGTSTLTVLFVTVRKCHRFGKIRKSQQSAETLIDGDLRDAVKNELNKYFCGKINLPLNIETFCSH